MKVSDVLPRGNYLNANVVKEQRLTGKPLTIQLVDLETLRGTPKLVVCFKETDKRLVLNRTNLDTLVEAFGDDTDKWIGKKIQLAITKVMYAGKRVDSISVVTGGSI
jgi:hypothetical protein